MGAPRRFARASSTVERVVPRDREMGLARWFTRCTSAIAGGSSMRPYERWRWWTVLLRGIAAVALGILSLIAPAFAFLSLVILFGIYAIVDGVLALGLAV